MHLLWNMPILLASKVMNTAIASKVMNAAQF